MKKFFEYFFLSLLLLGFISLDYTQAAKLITEPDPFMKERVKKIKESTVEIIASYGNSKSSGTGFVVSKEGLIATCFHVVGRAHYETDSSITYSLASTIEVVFNSNDTVSAVVYNPNKNGEELREAISKDYCILSLSSKRNVVPLKLGNFSDAEEGDSIYICGYPLGISQPVVATGMLSSKFLDGGYYFRNVHREVAWLDLTMNTGNSGGPIVLMGKNPDDDVVIGIANFILNPFSTPAENMKSTFEFERANVTRTGDDWKNFAVLASEALSYSSLGVGGCVSIDYLKKSLNK
jgi:serine protease Do